MKELEKGQYYVAWVSLKNFIKNYNGDTYKLNRIDIVKAMDDIEHELDCE